MPPADETTQLREITAQIQHRSQVYDNWGFRAKNNRGLGVSVLFAGKAEPARPWPPKSSRML
ncbi:MAG: hypothetical protein U0996_25565 [Planctomycetaceae bacterium]